MGAHRDCIIGRQRSVKYGLKCFYCKLEGDSNSGGKARLFLLQIFVLKFDYVNKMLSTWHNKTKNISKRNPLLLLVATVHSYQFLSDIIIIIQVRLFFFLRLAASSQFSDGRFDFTLRLLHLSYMGMNKLCLGSQFKT